MKSLQDLFLAADYSLVHSELTLQAIQQLDMFHAFKQAKSMWFEDALDALEISEISGWPDRFGDALLKWNASNPVKDIRTLSLFSGGGGLDIGFHDAGFNIVESNEIVPAFAATLEKNTADGRRLSGTRIVCKDINDYHPDLDNIDFIIGGPPCQTFSAAGARAAGVNGTDDERGNLFIQYARLIYKLQPKGFLFENVYRIVGAQSGKPWQQIQAAFEELGYKLYWRILDASDYGVPQFRERLIIVGLKTGAFNFPYPSHGPDSGDNRNYYSAKQALETVINSDNIPKALGGRHGHLLNDIPPGLNYSYYTERMGHPTPFFAWRSKFSDYLYKADPHTPVRTIKAQGGQYTGPFSWENRPFTVEELKRLQTFPDSYLINGNRQTAIHQLGNSVPPQFARVLALSIMKQVFSEKIPFDIKFMPANYELGFRARKSKLTDVYALKAKEAIDKIPSSINNAAKHVKHQEYFCIDSDLKVRAGLSKEEASYFVNYSLDSENWTINVSEPPIGIDEVKYKIIIQPPRTDTVLLKSTIELTSAINGEYSILVLWKIFEFLLKRHFLKDDLIQLFGYYQYKKSYQFKMFFQDKSLSDNNYWNVVKKVTEGIGVGVISSFEELSTEFGCSSVELQDILSKMKDYGFEIRNHNTNRQIQKGMILIPYSFPTLNERSLQRLTRL